MPEADFDSGFAAGEIAAKLKEHDSHLTKINGSMERVADTLQALTLAVQRLGDQAEADRRTVITTAAALKAAEEARLATSEKHWTPWQRAFAAIGALVALVTAGVLIAVNVH